MNQIETPNRKETLEAALGHFFSRAELLEQALTHKSFANEQAGVNGKSTPSDNERLEFLGDAVLSLALSDALMRRFPGDPEGGLSKKRASLVNEESLAKLALRLKLEDSIRLGRGEQKTGGGAKPRILASSLEAVFGAVFLESGFTGAAALIERLYAEMIEEVAVSDVDFRHDFKTRLQERVQERHRATPSYRVESESGPDHDKQFSISVLVNDQALAIGSGKSKKAAEQDAARQALENWT